jgi:hypothetical protein
MFLSRVSASEWKPAATISRHPRLEGASVGARNISRPFINRLLICGMKESHEGSFSLKNSGGRHESER